MLPSGKRAKHAHSMIVSVCLHYGTTLFGCHGNVPWQIGK